MRDSLEHAYSHPSREYVAHLIQAARVERAEAVRRAFLTLFHWHRKEQAWPVGKEPAVSLSGCG